VKTAIIAAVILLLALCLGYFVSQPRSEQLVQLASQDSGFISEILVKSGQDIKKGDLLLELNNSQYQNKKKAVLKIHHSIEKEIEQIEKNINEEEEKKKVFEQLCHKKIELLETEIKALQGQAEAFRKLYDRGLRLTSTGALSREEFEHRQGNYLSVMSIIEVKQRQILLHNYILKQAGKGRVIISTDGSYSGMDIKSNLLPILENLSRKKTELAQVDLQLAEIEEQINKTKTYATISGKIKNIKHLKGDFISVNEQLISILPEKD